MLRPRSLSPDAIARLRVKNRRKQYLDLHPEYLESPALELADPLAYDRLIRRFQTAAEREEEGRKKGYSGTLEADLQRSEAKVDALKNPDEAAKMRYRRDDRGEITSEERSEVPLTKEEGRERWRKEMELRFLKGADSDFDYTAVDENEEYDDKLTMERERQEEWFDDEEPSLIEDESPDKPAGDTGIQDF